MRMQIDRTPKKEGEKPEREKGNEKAGNT